MLRVIAAIILGIIAGCIMFCLIGMAGMDYLEWDMARKNPGDVSAGDSAGWAMVIFAPIAIPIMAIAGTVTAVITGNLTYRTLKNRKLKKMGMALEDKDKGAL